MHHKSILLFFLVLLLGGCASIEIERTGGKGFKVYAPKPYILMARAGEGGKVISVTPVMLPDLADPHYVRQTSGIGKANLTFTVENGLLKQFGGDVDSKIPETLKEIGGLATSYGALAKALAEAGKTRAETAKLREEGLDVTKLNAAAAKFQSAAGQMDKLIKGGSGLSADQAGALAGWKDTLVSLAKTLTNPNIDLDQALLDDLAKKANAVADAFEKASANYPEALRQDVSATTVPVEIRAGVKEIASKPAETPVFELYEVKQDQHGTTLVRVPLP